MPAATPAASAGLAYVPGVAEIEAGRRHDLITNLLNAWMILGLFMDIWAHGMSLPETFFTPWHAMLYSGYFATAAWLAWPVARAIQAGRPAFADLRAGHALGVAGILVFTAGGVGDMFWHVVYGVERGIEPFLSPPHLLLFVGMALMTTCPFRAAWAEKTGQRAPSFRALFPALLSLALSMTIASTVLVYLWGFATQDIMAPTTKLSLLLNLSNDFSAQMLKTLTQQEAIGRILLTNLALLAPVLLILRRWQPPFGSVTLLYAIMGIFIGPTTGYWYLPVLVVTGLIADWLIGAMAPTPLKIGSFRAFSVLLPTILWGSFFLTVRLNWGILWPPTLWLGVTMTTALSGLGLSLVMVPDASA